MGFRTWFSLKGRISRRTWFIFYFLIPNGIIFAASLLDARVLPKNTMPAALGKGMGELSVVSAVALLVGLWLSLAGQVKRWHDQDRTGWWGCLTPIPIFLIVWFLFFIDATTQIFLVYLTAQIAFPLAFMLFLTVTGADPNANQFVLAGMGFVACSLLFLWVLFFANGSFLPGTRGPNRFGPDPLAPKGADKNTAMEASREAVIRTDSAQMAVHQTDQKKSYGNLISLAQWFSHKGRISRKTWWIFYCLVPVCLMVMLGAAQQMIKLGVETPHKSSIGEYAMLAVFYSLGLVILWIGFAGLTKRWHDQDKSGRWVVLFFVPIILSPLFLILFSLVDLNGFRGLDHGWIGGIFTLIFTLTSLLPMIILFGACAVAGFQPGTHGPNRFGPDPLAPTATNIALPPSPQ